MTLLFKGIGYESLRLDGPIHPQRLNELSITRKLNEHGYMTVTGILPEEEGAQAIQTELEGQPVVLRQLDEEGHSVRRLFHGRITRFTVHCIRSIYTFELEAISQSGQMDMERKWRSFQHTEQTYADLVATVVREYTYGDAIDTIANATTLGGLILQYDETDWQFLKRLASRFGSVLVPEITAASPKVFFGMPEGKSYTLGEDTFYRIRKTFGQTRSAGGEVEEYSTHASASSNNKPMPGYISYFIDSLHYYALGDHLTLPASAGSTELVVVQADTVLRDGLLETSYELQHSQQIRFYSYDNEQIIGITLTGTVQEVAADFVRVKLDIDEDYYHKHPKAAVNKELGWFPVSTPYAAEQHTGWYDMPEKGEQVELHIPNSLESNAHVMGSLRQQSSGVSDPDTKIWSHPAGSQVQMDGQELRLSTSGHMTISLQPDSGIEITSPGSIGIQGGSVQLHASQLLSLEAGEAIRLKGSQSSMIVDGDTDLHAPTIHEVGTVKAPVVVADLAPVPEPPLMTVEAYQSGQAAAQQQKSKVSAKVTPPTDTARTTALSGLLSKAMGSIPLVLGGAALMATGAPMAGITGAMMMISAGAPVRVSGNTNGGGGSKKGGLLGVLGKLVSTASHLYNTATENEQNARFAMFRALGKVFTQARHISKLITDPKEYIRQVHTEMDHAYRTYQQVPPEIRQYWNARYAAYQAANSKPEYDFSQYHKVFLNGQWYLSKDGKLDQDALRATKAYKEEIKKGTIQSEEAGGQQDIMLEQLNAAEAGYNLWNGQPISEAQFHLMQIDYVMSNVPGIGGLRRGIGINGPVRQPVDIKFPNRRIPSNQIPSRIKENKDADITYYRVQGGTPPNASWERIKINGDTSISIEKGINVNISTGNIEHARYFLREKRPGGEIVAFDMPKWFDDFVKETAIDQKGYKKNPMNQSKKAPKIVDPTTPGDSYEFPPIWSEWFEEYAKNGRRIDDVKD
ncbi:contractile injection system protein, VgrG/Pvc8 family [Paenibacillus bovis]|uniref:Gp5/Type VI secretion system Vgr protein OB-fold domain-containing protein n=1 Tax=Paenibacillus bovis TaxID=1616788 RepID=A0A172ZJK7_9BACL|nr:contractile injection system protein, VgrG/Pvc8 family [Paenibacillus bovis]ANF97582.1 hypothetical protein AR543_17255 [Paenibacillus bovis]